MVDTVDALQKMAEALSQGTEIAIDLEHHSHRSYQGFTCLMQISTRTEDFIVDTLKLREHLGPSLQFVFDDPKITKVLHGSDSDI